MVDVVKLLEPISEQSLTGNYLKLDRSIYRTLRNHYNAAQSSFRQLIETPDASSDEALVEANQSNWDQLRSATFEALTQSTKDLELLGWYISSQLFTAEPYKNLADSTQVLSGFIDNFWGELHPTLPDNKIKGDDEQSKLKQQAEFRIKPLLQLVGETNESTALFMPLQLTSLIDSMTFGDFLRAERAGELKAFKEQALQNFHPEVEQTLLQLAAAYQNFTQAEQTLAKECQTLGVAPISFRFVKANLADLIKAIRFLCEEKFAFWPLDDAYQVRQPSDEPIAEPNQTEQASAAAHDGQISAPISEPANAALDGATASAQALNSAANQGQAAHLAAPQAIGQITNRDQAFKQLRNISDFFKQTEPHSPITFLLERAIRWGYMSLPELMQEMTAGNSNVMQQINQLTGMDNLEQLDLSDKGSSQSVVVSSNAVATSGATAPKNQTSPVEINTQEKADTNQSQTKASSSQSSGNLNDFEW